MDVVLGVAAGSSVPTTLPRLEASAGQAVSAPRDPEAALAQGAALATAGLAAAAEASTGALAYTQEAEFGPITPGYYDIPACLTGFAANDLAYSAVPDEQADADTEAFYTAPQPVRRPLLVGGAALASTAFAAASALMVSMTLDVTPKLVALRPDIVRTLTMPTIPFRIPNLQIPGSRPLSGQPPVMGQAPVNPPPPPLNRPQTLPAPVNSSPVPPVPPVAAPSPARGAVAPEFQRLLNDPFFNRPPEFHRYYNEPFFGRSRAFDSVFNDPFFTQPTPLSTWYINQRMWGLPPGTEVQESHISWTFRSNGLSGFVLRESSGDSMRRSEPRGISPGGVPAPPNVIPDPPMVNPHPPIELPPPPPPPPLDLPAPPVVEPNPGIPPPDLPVKMPEAPVANPNPA